MTSFPHPIDQASHRLIRGRDFMKFFQIIEATRNLQSSLCSQEVRSIPLRYIFFSTKFHNPLSDRPLQHDLAAKDWANQYIFQIPHPPFSFGLAMFCYLIKWNPVFFLAPLQKKFAMSCWILWRMEEGILTRLSQYTGRLCNTNLAKISLPPKESQQKDQFPILLSTF